MSNLHSVINKVRWKLAQRHARPGRYNPARFWDARARDLIDAYDAGGNQGWMSNGIEEREVPTWLSELGCRSVIVAGAGSGRQYAYLDGFAVAGFDVSPRLVEECRRRFPDIETRVADILAVTGEPCDAVICSGVLQHVEPSKIADAVARLGELARTTLIIREMTSFTGASGYQWAHDYETLLKGWTRIRSVTTDDRPDVTVELMAFTR